MCLGTAKLRCFSLHKWEFLFSLICPCMLCSKRKLCRENKIKKNQNAFNMIAGMFLGDMGVIGCTSKVTVPIKQLWLCVSVIDFLISQILIIWDTYALLLCFHTTRKFFAIFGTCASTMWFGYHKKYMCRCMLTKLSWLFFEI